MIDERAWVMIVMEERLIISLGKSRNFWSLGKVGASQIIRDISRSVNWKLAKQISICLKINIYIYELSGNFKIYFYVHTSTCF